MTERLIAAANGQVMGYVTRERHGRLAFSYDEAWRRASGAYPLSRSMGETLPRLRAQRVLPVAGDGRGLSGRSSVCGPRPRRPPARRARSGGRLADGGAGRRSPARAERGRERLAPTRRRRPVQPRGRAGQDGSVPGRRAMGSASRPDAHDAHSATSDSRLSRTLRKRASMPDARPRARSRGGSLAGPPVRRREGAHRGTVRPRGDCRWPRASPPGRSLPGPRSAADGEVRERRRPRVRSSVRSR